MDNEKEFEKKNVIFKLNKEILTLVVLIALVVVSGVQTVKLSGLKANNVGATTVPTTTGSSSDLPSSLQNLPSQVGGC